MIFSAFLLFKLMTEQIVPEEGHVFLVQKLSYRLKSRFSSQWAFTCPKLTIETVEQGLKYVQS